MNNNISIDFYFYHFNKDGNPVWTEDDKQHRVSMNDESAIEVIKQTLIGQDFFMLPGFIEIKWNGRIILDEDDYMDDLLCTWDSLLTGLIKDYQEPPWPILSLTANSYDIIASDNEVELVIVRPNYLELKDEKMNIKHIPLKLFNKEVFNASKRFMQFINNFDFDLEESSYKDLLETQVLLEKKFT